ncbi:uncharacterized protein HD556DRAFT_295800 [Suillus plorans]|uniref:F-box domain-containing protein n=1 Tax=Suillus plorans TaxID=116603 RepID=A0A9P7ATG0_9AGAM|nr:uncharacterized protein HD556DRAFT_295800 [Suillus plorans]KAG1796360.1 hypothetical protein HD556DRAFT_295800 [Suillus plorans]
MNYPTPLINRLPVELLQQVFLLILNDVQENPSIFLFGDTCISADVASPPLLLTRVCRLWRDIAHSTTAIWSRIHVALPGRIQPLKPFLPSLLEVWLARSGCRPLSLSIVSEQLCYSRDPEARCLPWLRPYQSEADCRLLEILLSVRGRWETVAIMSPAIYDWSGNIDTPRLRTLKCFLREFRRFNAPNLHCLHIFNRSDFPAKPAPICKDIRHLRLQHTSVNAIRFTSVIFPHLETMIVDDYSLGSGDRIDTVAQPRLKSMTLPLTSDRQEFIDILDGFHLPMLQKLTVVVEELRPLEIECIMAALAVATCREPTVDLKMATPPSEVDIDIVEPLLLVAKEVTVCGKVLEDPVRGASVL